RLPPPPPPPPHNYLLHNHLGRRTFYHRRHLHIHHHRPHSRRHLCNHHPHPRNHRRHLHIRHHLSHNHLLLGLLRRRHHPFLDVASLTVMFLPMKSVSFKLPIASFAADSSSNVTNANPRGRPVSRSFIIATSEMRPNSSNLDRISSSLAS
uniref:Uncharacterized protein n=1 Tax=Ciona savignyi TaxID=51511 RepID=H2YSP1_CIOSA